MHRPLLVDLTVEEGTRLKVIYGSADGFHAVDLDSASVYDIYMPKHVKYTVVSFNLFYLLVNSLLSHRDRYHLTVLFPCQTQMECNCFFATIMKVFT
jgi:hypothetical protein